MRPTIRVFISSVQKELELERAAVAALISTDPFLLQHCDPVRFDKEPPPPRPKHKPYLAALQRCQAYVLILANEYGDRAGELSATHEEYRLAQKMKLPSVVFLKGATDDSRKPEVKALIDEAKNDGFTYQRFHDREDLRPLMLAALRRMLGEEFDIHATDEEVSEGEHQIEAASPFESAILQDESVANLDEGLLNRFNQAIAANSAEKIFRSGAEALHARGLAASSAKRGGLQPTAAAFVVFAPKPASRFPQCEILADVYETPHVSGRPKGQVNINAPLPLALEQAEKFVDDVTFHPRRVVGLNNVRLNEYPVPALREALVNAMAHRDYGDRSRKILLRIYSDRLVVSSPGYPLKPLTPARLRKGGYSPCSRNPMIAQTLATLSLMEQRGTGFARMREAMLNHGLEEPKIEQQDGFFVVTLPGPDGDYDRIRTPATTSGPVTPAIEAQLNERQKRIVIRVANNGTVTRGWCVSEFGVANDTAGRDLKRLTELGLLQAVGKGRAVRYVAKTTENRPTR